MKEVIFKAIVILTMFGLMGYGVFFMLKKEESGYPRYEIRQDREFFRTDTFTIDSLGCLHFVEFHKRLFKVDKRPITICGGKYIITDRDGK